jgi:hypothetical protein
MMRATALDLDVKTSSMSGTSFPLRPHGKLHFACRASYVHQKVPPALPGARRFYELAQILAVTLTCLAAAHVAAEYIRKRL